MFKQLATAATLAVTLTTPAQANEDVLKGILAVIVINEVMNSSDQGYSDGHEIRPQQPAQPITPRNAPGYYDQSKSCKVQVNRGNLYTTRTVYNCYGAILEHESWPNN